MDGPWAWDVAAWSTVGVWLTAGIYLAILLFAARQVAAARHQVDEARQLREEQARPFVVVDFTPALLSHVVVENIGKTMARDVTIRFDPPLESTLRKPWAWEESSLFTEGLPMLPPDKRLRATFDQLPARFDSDLPLKYEVELRYRGPSKAKVEFVDRYTLDLRTYYGLTRPPKDMPDLVQTLDSVRDEIKKWTDGTRGLLVSAQNRDRHARYDNRRYWIRQATAVREQHGWLAWTRYLVERALQRRGWIE